MSMSIGVERNTRGTCFTSCRSTLVWLEGSRLGGMLYDSQPQLCFEGKEFKFLQVGL
jgi:hypothetical protein